MTIGETNTDFMIGDRVLLRGDELGAWMRGVIIRKTECQIKIHPDSTAMRNWYPNGYVLGAAHWSRLQLVTRILPSVER